MNTDSKLDSYFHCPSLQCFFLLKFLLAYPFYEIIKQRKREFFRKTGWRYENDSHAVTRRQIDDIWVVTNIGKVLIKHMRHSFVKGADYLKLLVPIAP